MKEQYKRIFDAFSDGSGEVSERKGMWFSSCCQENKVETSYGEGVEGTAGRENKTTINEPVITRVE